MHEAFNLLLQYFSVQFFKKLYGCNPVPSPRWALMSLALPGQASSPPN